MIVKDVLSLLFFKGEKHEEKYIYSLIFYGCFKQLIASVMKKVGSHGDHQGVLLACQDEILAIIGYHLDKYLSKSGK